MGLFSSSAFTCLSEKFHGLPNVFRSAACSLMNENVPRQSPKENLPHPLPLSTTLRATPASLGEQNNKMSPQTKAWEIHCQNQSRDRCKRQHAQTHADLTPQCLAQATNTIWADLSSHAFLNGLLFAQHTLSHELLKHSCSRPWGTTFISDCGSGDVNVCQEWCSSTGSYLEARRWANWSLEVLSQTVIVSC